MAPVTKLNNWIVSKIAGYLAYKEGCIIEGIEYTPDGAKSLVKDAFGFKYEISIKTISRNTDALVNRYPESYKLIERLK